ncbi:hypothetical protein [Roseofilum capinflatum]|uniref:Uncharacterized protein n=1 Tax=Roseofilum capinflatum BLCC-M114 TaxID=3022440 RepID=A0ABT7B6T9_9CYAN|nr:hypothetical protein [Roseofilum capinflatum]MDJ1174886.1 hypothetical protein [Roseofilum capinflatum BLCC-M114]
MARSRRIIPNSKQKKTKANIFDEQKPTKRKVTRKVFCNLDSDCDAMMAQIIYRADIYGIQITRSELFNMGIRLISQKLGYIGEPDFKEIPERANYTETFKELKELNGRRCDYKYSTEKDLLLEEMLGKLERGEFPDYHVSRIRHVISDLERNKREREAGDYTKEERENLDREYAIEKKRGRPMNELIRDAHAMAMYEKSSIH